MRQEPRRLSTNPGARSGELGQSLVIFTMFLAAACGFVGLVTDVGFVMRDRTALQAGVDSAALAGASALPDEEAATALATEWAEKNGLTEAGVTLTINTPYNGDPTKIEVTAKMTQSAFFAKVFGIEIFNVSARAVGTTQAGGGLNAAMLALNPTKCSAFNKAGSSSIIINNSGGIMVNSSCDPSLDVSGGGTVTAAVINYYEPGGYQESGSQLNPIPVPLTQPIPDPLRNVPPPNLSSMSTSPDSGGTASHPIMKTASSGTVTLNPGIYWGGLTVKSSANVTLNPGIYVMAGGGFQVQGGPTITGTGVMIYTTFDPEKPTGAGACGAIDLSGSGTWAYSPPTSGPFKGIALWQDKNCTNNVKLTGSNGGPSGAIYAPTAMVNMSGSGALGSIQIIADTFDITGSGNMSVDFVPYLTIPMQLTMKLVE
ncbi:MAG: pilus assembly protein TadG-related protein [Dehalococcoidia bacterium]